VNRNTWVLLGSLSLSASLCTAQTSNTEDEEKKASQKSEVFCPICVANGYASGIRNPKEWFATINSVGTAIWNTSIPRVQIGATYHGSSKAIRGLFGYRILDEGFDKPGLNFSYGIQSQETGATGTSLTLEKNFFKGRQSLNTFAGVAFRTTETVGRFVGGFKYSNDDKWFFGNQYDGRDNNPFVQLTKGNQSVGLLMVASKNLSLTFGITF
jgi:hypothetical protein